MFFVLLQRSQNKVIDRLLWSKLHNCHMPTQQHILLVLRLPLHILSYTEFCCYVGLRFRSVCCFSSRDACSIFDFVRNFQAIDSLNRNGTVLNNSSFVSYQFSRCPVHVQSRNCFSEAIDELCIASAGRCVCRRIRTTTSYKLH
ncbi:Hypothetical_protein [Hexamita inflata]|uniref:Hypothetical_protein n=1 Tax=Hexamita inflata TaxID=28002 RepID=A0ABP1JAR8_9EUKA